MPPIALLFFPVFILLFLNGCALLSPSAKPADQAEARALITRLKAHNETLVRFKGIGKAKIAAKNTTVSTRVAWAGELPDKLRIEILNITGKPAATLAADGKTVYLHLHDQGDFHRKQTRSGDLSHLIDVPLTTDQMLKILSQQYDIRPYSTVYLQKTETGDILLILKNFFKGKIQTIQINDTAQVTKCDYYTTGGSLLYRVEFSDYQSVEGFSFYRRLTISSPGRGTFDLSTDRFWPNASINSDIFSLSPP